MKNKIFAIVLALTMVFAFAACSKTETADVTTAVASTKAETTAVEESKTEDATTEKTTKAVSKTVITNSVNLVGTWEDKVSQRAILEVRSGSGSNNYSLHAHWSSSAYEAEDWYMTGTYNTTTGELTYSDCRRVTTTYATDNDSDKTEDVQYTNGSGKFVYKNGELSWQADNDGDVNDCVFKR